jgi:hypothetical protein
MPTPIHDVLGFSFLVLAIAHTYFSLMSTNRAILKAMVTGKEVLPFPNQATSLSDRIENKDRP